MSLFERARFRHRFTARRLRVAAVTSVEQYTRVTLTGPTLADWASFGPGDHARTFFPDPETGELNAPEPAGPDEDGIVRPDGPTHGRDFTPLNIRDDAASGERFFDIDILRHENAGPAARWAEHAAIGDELVVVGPRGSVAVAVDAPRVLCVVDETALPAAARWITDMPSSAEIEVLVDLAEPTDHAWVARYLRDLTGRDVPVTVAGAEPDGLAAVVRERTVDDRTFVFAAGEAGRLVPLRRYLRHELQLPREQYAVTGYWKQNAAAFDHHAPIDPEDPED